MNILIWWSTSSQPECNIIQIILLNTVRHSLPSHECLLKDNVVIVQLTEMQVLYVTKAFRHTLWLTHTNSFPSEVHSTSTC